MIIFVTNKRKNTRLINQQLYGSFEHTCAYVQKLRTSV